MKLSSKLLRKLQIGESVIITDSTKGKVKGAGDISCRTNRLKPKRFTIKRLLLTDPEEMTTVRVVRITRIEDFNTVVLDYSI